MSEHDDALSRILAASRQSRFTTLGVPYPKAWYEGLAARMRGDDAGAREAFAAARLELEKSLLADPTDGKVLSLLSMVDAALGQREAIAGAQRACALTAPTPRSAPMVGCHLAVVYAWLGQPDPAFAELEKWMVLPASGNLPAEPT